MKDWIKENIVLPWRTRTERRAVKAGTISSLFIELTNHCNFSCDFCAYPFMKREKRHMDFELACHILEQAAEEGIAERLFPHFVGEPFLYPYLFEFLEKAAEKDIPVELFTNASLLDEEGIRRLYGLKIKRLLLSFQTPDERSFKYRRAPLSFNKFLGKTESLIENKFACNSSTEIEIQFLSTSRISPGGKAHSLETLNEMKGALTLFEEISRDIGKKFNLHDTCPTRLVLNDLPPSGTRFNLLPGVEIYFRHACLWNSPPQLIGQGNTIRKTRRGYCPLPFEMLLVLSNGNVTCCCMDYEGEINLGSVKEASLRDIWSGEKLARIRDGMKKAFLTEEVCQRCQGEIKGPHKTDVLKCAP